ncbi:MAG TPA: DUF5995 family protein [Vicinamibacterales bacterium]
MIDTVLTSVIGEVHTIHDVITAMRAIEAALPERDGVRWFNLLYRTVTEAVQADAAGWEDWPFLQRFDVAFAKLYFEAVTSWESDPTRTARAWRPLFQARHDGNVAPLQFALAGMNAHINNDLVIALDRLAQSEKQYPSKDGERYRDFLRVNDVLERVEVELQPVLSTGVIGALDVALGDLDTILAMWKVRNAREAAWTNGEVVWHLRVAPHLRREYLARLDHMVGFAGRGLLAPIPEIAKQRSGLR